MIDVLQLMSERKIKDKTILKVLDNTGKIVCTYEYDAECENFYGTYSYSETLDIINRFVHTKHDTFKFNITFLNANVVLIDPES